MKNMLNKICSKVTCAFVTRERKESGDHLVEILGTILIAVVVLLFFKDEILKIFEKVFDSVATSIESLFSNGETTP